MAKGGKDMKIAVYCGSRHGDLEEYTKRAEELAAWIASEGHELVYGGGKLGLMGVVSDGVIQNGGEVFGVIPHFLADKELVNEDITDLTRVETMSERKLLMMHMADAYIALPGGPGTLEEIAEIISMVRLDQFSKPCILYNIDGFYDSLQKFIISMADHDFMEHDQLNKWRFVSNLDEIKEILR